MDVCVPAELNHYHVDEELGSGGFSVVYRVEDKNTGIKYAAKVFPKTNLSHPGDQERFQREIDAMAYLKHDNIVALKDFLWDANNYYLIMDLCEGRELLSYVTEHKKLDEPLAALIFRQIVDAVRYCHSRGVAHRDLKPENVLFSTFPHVKVADFGLCGYVKESQLMKTFCGSPCYCAPECLCKVQYDGREADVWSIGVILFLMVTGQHPWNVVNTSMMTRQILKGSYTVPKTVSDECKDLIESMLKVDPKERITVDKIAAHPWLTRAEEATTGDAEPSLMELAMKGPVSAALKQKSRDDDEKPIQLSELVGKSTNVSNDQFKIQSPFAVGGEVEETGGGIKLCSMRSASVEDMKLIIDPPKRKEAAPPANDKKGVRIKFGQQRQRSSQNLLAKKFSFKVRRASEDVPDLTTIDE